MKLHYKEMQSLWLRNTTSRRTVFRYAFEYTFDSQWANIYDIYAYSTYYLNKERQYRNSLTNVINDLVADNTSVLVERKKMVTTKTILGLLPKERLQLENLICLSTG